MSNRGWRYRAWDIDVLVPFPVPDLVETEKRGIPDLILRVGVTASHSNSVRFALPGGAPIAMVGSRLACVESDRGPADLHPSLVRSILAVVLRRQGRVVLHAAAVQVANRTIALCGASGSGKSTLAALLCSQGAKLVTDELCAVALEGPAANVLPGTRLLALSPDAYTLSGLSSPRPRRNGRFLVEMPVVPTSLPLDALYFLDWDPVDRTTVVRASGALLARCLLLARFQPEVGPLDDKARELELLGRLATLCPAFRLTRSESEGADQVIQRLLEHVQCAE